MLPLIPMAMGGANTLLQIAAQNRAREAQRERYNDYNKDIIQRGLDDPINYRWGRSYNLAKQTSNSSRIGARTNLNNNISRNNRRAMQAGLGISDTAELNAGVANRTMNANAQQLARSTQGFAQNLYRQDKDNRQRELDYVKQYHYNKPTKRNPYNTIGQITKGLGGMYQAGAQSFYNNQNRKNMLGFLEHQKMGTMDKFSPDTQSFGNHLLGGFQNFFEGGKRTNRKDNSSFITQQFGKPNTYIG